MMHVWIEPLEWDENKGPCPIAQLDIHTTSYLKDKEASGTRAVSATDNPCSSLLYPVFHSTDLHAP